MRISKIGLAVTTMMTAGICFGSTSAMAAANPCPTGIQGCVLPLQEPVAVAQPQPAPVPAPAYVSAPIDDAPAFTGFHIEAIGGYDTLRSGERDDGVDTSTNEGDESIDGIVYGVGAGFDFNVGNLVLGVEGEYTESTGKQQADETVDGLNLHTRIATGRDIYVGGRIGFQAGAGTLIYAKAGYTNTSIEAAADYDDERFELDTNVDGWRVGAGIEQRFGSNMFGRLEYRYSNYNNLDFSDDFDLGDLDPEDYSRDIDLDRHQVVAAIGFRF